MKATLFLTTACNLRCDYCYVSRQNFAMSGETLDRAIDFVFQTTAPGDRIRFDLSGGEPLLAWPLVQKTVALIEQKAGMGNHPLQISLSTNGTLLTRDILTFVRRNNVMLHISCDGIAHVQDKHRRFRNGKRSSQRVVAGLSHALEDLPGVIVDMVYGPDTCAFLPESIEYLASLGLKQLVLIPDCTASWHKSDIERLGRAFEGIADTYLDSYAREAPVFISLIDEKIAVMMRGGYGHAERSRMGEDRVAVSPQGVVFPCEHLVGTGEESVHSMSSLYRQDLPEETGSRPVPSTGTGGHCASCTLYRYCMNGSGELQVFGNDSKTQPSPFICASERLSIQAAHKVMAEWQITAG
ncbi:MAG: radical SAM protein [Desulfobacter sp.]